MFMPELQRDKLEVVAVYGEQVGAVGAAQGMKIQARREVEFVQCFAHAAPEMRGLGSNGDGLSAKPCEGAR